MLVIMMLATMWLAVKTTHKMSVMMMLVMMLVMMMLVILVTKSVTQSLWHHVNSHLVKLQPSEQGSAAFLAQP